MLTQLLLAATQEPPPNMSELKDLAVKYQLTIKFPQEDETYKASNYTLTYSPFAQEQLNKYLPLFNKEWNLYPPSLIKKSGITQIILCTNLALNDQKRAAVPSWDNNTMYYDIAAGAHKPNYQRVVVHHEFFHIIDYRQNLITTDPEWIALNAPDFNYGTGGENMRTSGVGELTKDIPGFLTPYSTASLAEDKAEIFAHLIVNPQFTTPQAQKDPILNAKITKLKGRLKEYDPNINEEFWPKPAPITP